MNKAHVPSMEDEENIKGCTYGISIDGAKGSPFPQEQHGYTHAADVTGLNYKVWFKLQTFIGVTEVCLWHQLAYINQEVKA